MKEKKELVTAEDPSFIMSIDVNGLRWDIYFKDQISFQQNVGREDCTFFGVAVRDRDEIWLWDQLRTHERMYRTIIHELTHIFIESYGFEQFTSFTEENVADLFECYAALIVDLAQQILVKVLERKAELNG